MVTNAQTNFLRKVLLADAATCIAAGAVMTLGSSIVAPLTNIPAWLLLPAGVSLIPIAAFMAFVATRRTVSRGAVWLVIAGNALWFLASAWLLFGDVIAPNVFGSIFITAQALAVAVLTWLEHRGVTQQTTTA